MSTVNQSLSGSFRIRHAGRVRVTQLQPALGSVISGFRSTAGR